MWKRCLLLGLLGSCAALEPDYFEVSPGYTWGSSDGRFADQPSYHADEDAYAVFFTVGWNVGETGEAMRNLARLDVSKAGQLTLRDPVEVYDRDWETTI